jgi:hypothetical protein
LAHCRTTRALCSAASRAHTAPPIERDRQRGVPRVATRPFYCAAWAAIFLSSSSLTAARRQPALFSASLVPPPAPCRKLLLLLNPPIRVRPKRVNRQPMTCSSNTKRGQQSKINGHRSDPCNRLKMPHHRLCKMPDDRSGPCQCTDRSVTCRMREQRSGRCKIPEKRSGGSKMHEYRSRPNTTPEHRVSLCKTPRRRRSCKASVCAIRPSRT